MSRLWITWETQRRNSELADAFGCTYARLDYSSLPGALRYAVSIARTIGLLVSQRPAVVFAQCPSLILCVLVALLKPIFRYFLLIDAHNAAVEYAFSSRPFVRFLARRSLRAADLVIVSNSRLAERFEKLGIKAAVLPDKLPEIAGHERPSWLEHSERPVVTLIATFASDEPIAEFLEAARETGDVFKFYVTGKRSRAGDLLELESESLRFTDFLPAEEFEALIRHSDLLVDLTTREDCLVCGAYEAVSIGVPVLLSDSAVNREIFPLGTLFAANSPKAYVKALGRFLREQEFLKAGSAEMRGKFAPLWQERFLEIERRLPQSAP